MNYYMCSSCFQAYKSDCIQTNKLGNAWCPNVECNGNMLFEIDELMIKPIQILNKKGYKTKYCCSGHSYEKYPSPYIMFNFIPSYCPKDWYIDDNCIRAKKYSIEEFLNFTLEEKQKYIFNSINNLLIWSLELLEK